VIKDTFVNFFADLYTEKQSYNRESLPMPPILHAECIHALDAPPTQSEIENLIKKIPSYSAPGLDGIPYRTYLIPELTILITRLFQTIWDGSSPPQSWLTAVIRPSLKEDKDPAFPNNYRPISLLPADYKLFTGIYNQRIQPFLHSIFPNHQTGFVRGRSPHLAALRLSHFLTSYPKASPALLDFEKAYDRVSHEWLFHILEHIQLPQRLLSFLKWTHINSSSCIIINNRLTNTFPTRSGVRQGDPLSPVLFNLSLEPLLIALRQDRIFAQAHADDTALALFQRTARRAITILNHYQRASGAKLNVSKSISLSRPTTPPWNCPFPISDKIERYLGFGLDPSGRLTLLPDTLPSIETKLHNWKRLPLTYATKAAILTAYIRPRLLYQLRIVPLQPAIKARYTSLENWFLSSHRTEFDPHHRYLPPPGLSRFHPLLSYRIRPFSLAVEMTQIALLPSIINFDPTIFPDPGRPHPTTKFLQKSAHDLATRLPAGDMRNTIANRELLHLVVKYKDGRKIREAYWKALTHAPVTPTAGQRTWNNAHGTCFVDLWRNIKRLGPRQGIITFAWKLINRALPTGHKFGQPCPLCAGSETSEHLLNAECPAIRSLDLRIAKPLTALLTPPHTPATLKEPLMLTWSIWLARNAVRHNSTTVPIATLFSNILQREISRHQHLHEHTHAPLMVSTPLY
jgi:Reverse transcriptase (RNA-dependent DNA polymerase)